MKFLKHHGSKGTDLFSLYNEKYVLVVDYFSGYTEVTRLNNESAKCVIDNIKKIFSHNGIPKEVMSDNGPQYTSYKFVDFARNWDFIHNSSSPHYPKSNGLAERTVQTVKRLMKKAFISNEDPYLALLNLNSTPKKNGLSPMQLMFNRTVRTTLPSISVFSNCKDLPLLDDRKEVKGREIKEIKPGTTVRILSEDKQMKWNKKGLVVAKLNQPRSYNVLNQSGNTIRRNRVHLIPTEEKFSIEKSDNWGSEENIQKETESEIIPNNSPVVAEEKINSPAALHLNTTNESLPTRTENTETLKTTRSGRITRKPKYLNDYSN